MLPFSWVAPTLLSSGGPEVLPGGRWGAGSRSPVCLPLVLTTFLANPPSSARLAGASAALVLCADGNAEVTEKGMQKTGNTTAALRLSPQDAERELTLYLTVALFVETG